MVLICKNCGKPFETANSKKKTCSPTCHGQLANKSKWAHLGDSPRNCCKIERTFICECCGKVFTKEARGNQKLKYCSDSCRNMSRPKRDETTRKAISKKMAEYFRDGKIKVPRPRTVEYKGHKYDSKLEVDFAKHLEDLGIEYIPHPTKFVYKNKLGEMHSYLPDFYIPSKDEYIDTKNPYLIEHVQKDIGLTGREKVEFVAVQNNVKIIILTREDILEYK